ncbi:MAG TPA: NifU family protein [Flavobacteriia bacterium]|nr:NifU family protein [Flavobacteriia bacterium]
MFTIERTNNDSIIKFVNDTILTEGSFEYHNIDDAKNSKLVQQLFYLPFVKKVFITANFIAVERYKIVEWQDVQEELKAMIQKYYNAYNSIFNPEEAVKKIAIQVYTEVTPNPNVVKYVTNSFLSKQRIEAINLEEAAEIPIAKEILEKYPVKEVFIAENYISIAKKDTIEWFEIQNDLRSFIRLYLQDGKPIVTENYIPKEVEVLQKTKENRANDTVSEEIISVLEEYIKPAVTADGGNIMFKSYDKDTKKVEVILQGACSGCPSSTITLKNGIEATLKSVLPNKIAEVVAING